MKNYKKILIIALLTIIYVNHLSAQEFIFPNFKAYPPFREMKCGLWINTNGDIAYKTIGCEVDEENEKTVADSLKSECTTIDFKIDEEGNGVIAYNELCIPKFKPSDEYIAWCYNVRDSTIDSMNENDYMSELKNVVDTASFKILSSSYFIDKNYVYGYIFMACGGHISVGRDIDKKTFKVFKSNPDFACDKYNCFVVGRKIEGADPKTFQPIKNEESLLYSRDKNHIYNMDQAMTDTEIIEIENGLGIKLFTQADVVNFTTEKFDSVKIAYTVYFDKETSSLGDTIPKNHIISEQSARLTSKEIEALNHYLLSPHSFTNNVPLLSHGDISISYYRDDTVAVNCFISSLTQRFTLINGVRTMEKSISPEFGKYITQLLTSKGIWTKR